MSPIITSIVLYLSFINAQNHAMHPHDYYTYTGYQAALRQTQQSSPLSPSYSSPPAPHPCNVERPFPRHAVPVCHYRMRSISSDWHTLPPVQEQQPMPSNQPHFMHTQPTTANNIHAEPIHSLACFAGAKNKSTTQPKYFTFDKTHIRLSIENRLNLNLSSAKKPIH